MWITVPCNTNLKVLGTKKSAKRFILKNVLNVNKEWFYGFKKWFWPKLHCYFWKIWYNFNSMYQRYVLHFKKPLFMKINLIILDFGAAMILLICIIIYFPKKVLHYLNKYSMWNFTSCRDLNPFLIYYYSLLLRRVLHLNYNEKVSEMVWSKS